MENPNKKVFRTIKEYFLITLGILIYTCGWTIFLTPNNMFGGGVSGISAIIQFATGIKMGYTYFVINAILLLISLFLIGPSFGIKTVYAIFLASFCLNIEQSIIPAQFIHDFALSNGKLMCAICAAPMIYGHKGLLKGRKACIYPGMEAELEGAEVSMEKAIRDGNFITSRGLGTAIPFALEILATLKGRDAADKMAKSIVYND